MAQEHKRSSNSSGRSSGSGSGKKPSKKVKPNKVPQRGMGIAALERLRLEKQWERMNVVVDAPPPQVQQDTSFSNPNHFLLPSIPISGSEFNMPPQPTKGYGPPQSLLAINSPSIYVPNVINSNGSVMGWSQGSKGDHGSLPSSLNSLEYSMFGGGTKFGVGSNSLQVDSALNDPPSIPVQTRQQNQPIPSMVNVSLSSGPSSVAPFSSSQSNFGNFLNPVRHNEKIISTRQSGPSALYYPPGYPLDSIIPYQFPPAAPQLCQALESSNGINGIVNLGPRNANFSEGRSGSTFRHAKGKGDTSQMNQFQNTKDNVALDGAFLTLGPLRALTMKQPMVVSTFNHKGPAAEYPNMLSLQGNTESSLNRANKPSPQESLGIPLEGNHQMGCSTGNLSSNNRRGKAKGTLDLNLKL